ncbi:MAG: DUF1622 domain-containing protein [Clostridium sp.]
MIIILEELFIEYLPILINTFELMGIIVLTIGAFTAFYHYIKSKISNDSYLLKYQFANAMVTALEFKLAAEILKTVIVRNLSEIFFLGSIFLIRVLMTFVLEKEIESENNKVDKSNKPLK